jgi:hypothetical protein
MVLQPQPHKLFCGNALETIGRGQPVRQSRVDLGSSPLGLFAVGADPYATALAVFPIVDAKKPLTNIN